MESVLQHVGFAIILTNNAIAIWVTIFAGMVNFNYGDVIFFLRVNNSVPLHLERTVCRLGHLCSSAALQLMSFYIQIKMFITILHIFCKFNKWIVFKKWPHGKACISLHLELFTQQIKGTCLKKGTYLIRTFVQIFTWLHLWHHP